MSGKIDLSKVGEWYRNDLAKEEQKKYSYMHVIEATIFIANKLDKMTRDNNQDQKQLIKNIKENVEYIKKTWPNVFKMARNRENILKAFENFSNKILINAENRDLVSALSKWSRFLDTKYIKRAEEYAFFTALPGFIQKPMKTIGKRIEAFYHTINGKISVFDNEVKNQEGNKEKEDQVKKQDIEKSSVGNVKKRIRELEDQIKAIENSEQELKREFKKVNSKWDSTKIDIGFIHSHLKSHGKIKNTEDWISSSRRFLEAAATKEEKRQIIQVDQSRMGWGREKTFLNVLTSVDARLREESLSVKQSMDSISNQIEKHQFERERVLTELDQLHKQVAAAVALAAIEAKNKSDQDKQKSIEAELLSRRNAVIAVLDEVIDTVPKKWFGLFKNDLPVFLLSAQVNIKKYKNSPEELDHYIKEIVNYLEKHDKGNKALTKLKQFINTSQEESSSRPRFPR